MVYSGGPHGAFPRSEPGQRWGWSYTEMWLVPGPYAGRGPRSVRRSDAAIRDDVNDRLYLHGCLDASDIEVEVQDGEVILSGRVDSRGAKRAAEDTAYTVSDVRDVINRLRIASALPGPVTRSTADEITPAAVAPERGDVRGAQTARMAQPAGVGDDDALASAAITPPAADETLSPQTTDISYGGGKADQGAPLTQVGQMRLGMTVVGRDGGTVGSVKETREGDFLVDRSLARDIYVPLTAVQGVEGDRVTLNVRASEVGGMGWEFSPLLGG